MKCLIEVKTFDLVVSTHPCWCQPTCLSYSSRFVVLACKFWSDRKRAPYYSEVESGILT